MAVLHCLEQQASLSILGSFFCRQLTVHDTLGSKVQSKDPT